MTVTPEEVLSYWIDEVGPEGWFRGGDDLDRDIREKFGPTLEAASEGALSLWLTYPSGTLAYVILTDQFSRNIHRGDSLAFAMDSAALAAAKAAIARGWDLKIDEPARRFFYYPLMHSECLVDQDRCVRLMMTRLPEMGPEGLLHARAHREVIRRFGRFPYRNDVLERPMKADEADFLEQGGYGAQVREIKGQEAA